MPTWLQDVNLCHCCSREGENTTFFLLWNVKRSSTALYLSQPDYLTRNSRQLQNRYKRVCQGSWGSTCLNQRQVRTVIAPEPSSSLAIKDTRGSKVFPFHCLFPAVLQFAITIRLVAFLCSSKLCNHSKKIINMRPVLHWHFSRVQLWSSLFCCVCLQLNSAPAVTAAL